MKNTIKLLGIIALAAVIGFSMAACGGDDDNGGGGSASWPSNLSGTRWTDNPAGIGDTLEFKTDNTCDTGQAGIVPLVSAVENGKIVVKYRGENETLCQSYSVSGTTLTFTSPSNKLLGSEATWTKKE